METTVAIGTQIVRNGITLTMTEDGWRAELQHSMMRRCKGWDYCQPWIYLITVGCQHHEVIPRPVGIPLKEEDQEETEDGKKSKAAEVITPLPHDWQMPAWLLEQYHKAGRPHLFGELAGTHEHPVIALNDLGLAVDRAIMSIPESFPEVAVLERVVMPNHIHIVLRVRRRLPEKKPLGFVVNKLKSWVNRRYKELCLGLPANTLMEVAQPGGVLFSQARCVLSSQSQTERTKPAGNLKNPKHGLVFEAGFHDRILFHKGQLAAMIDYCRDNPRRLWNVVNNSRYFRVLRNVRITLPVIAASGTKGQGRWNGPVDGLLEELSPAGAFSSSQSWASSPSQSRTERMEPAERTITFNVIGNSNLLTVPHRVQIQCSRSLTAEAIERQTEETLAMCEHGVVPVSPCISPGEKAIARAVMEAGYNLIVLLPQGIPDSAYKPYRQYFDACASGQLLMMSPWKFQNGVSHVKRWQCLFLNDIAAQLVVAYESNN